jgi:glutathione S-transferase
MTTAPIKIFQFPRMFAIPNLSPFCCKLETWLRIADIAYEVVDTGDPRKGPHGKLPFIEDAGARIADTSVIIRHLKETRGVDPDAHLDATQRATALLVQRTLEEHYAFALAYTHLYREEGLRHTRSRFDAIPGIIRPLVARAVKGQVRKILWFQGLLRHSDGEIMNAAIQDWSAVWALKSAGPFFFGAEPSGIDAVVFGTLASSVLTPIESPVRDFLCAKPDVVAYAEGMRARFFPELVPAKRSASGSARPTAIAATL